MNLLLAIKRVSHRILYVLQVGAVAILVLDVLLGVASRYLWGEQVKWTEELAILLLVWVSFLGIAAAFESRAHLGIDALTERFAPDARQRLTLITHLLTLTFVIAVFLVGGGILVRQALLHWNVLPALQVSDVVMYLPLPVSGILILIYESVNLVNDWHKEKERNNG